MSNCGECEGHGFVFGHRDGDILIKDCPKCSGAQSPPAPTRGFWLSVNWKPNEDSPPGKKEWSVRLIEERDGVVRLTPLTAQQVSEICSVNRANLLLTGLIVLASEVAALKGFVRAFAWALIASMAMIAALAGFIASGAWRAT